MAVEPLSVQANIDAAPGQPNPTGMADDDVSETEDIGDIWLTFWVVSALSAAASFVLIGLAKPTGWVALVGAVPLGLTVGGLVSRIRLARRWISSAVQTIFIPWW